MPISLTGGGSKNYCLKKCTPQLGSRGCDGKLACLPSSARFVAGKLQAFCLLYGCQTLGDCPVATSKTCTTSGAACPSGQLCLALASGTTQGRCAKPGVCDMASGLCNAHKLGTSTAKVGQPCNADTQCAGNMKCLLPLNPSSFRKKMNQSCSSGAECCSNSCQGGTCTRGICALENRNGYCAISGCAFASSLPLRACPAGSTCNNLYTGGLCQRSCNLASTNDCRGVAGDRYGDYECRSWDRLTINNQPLAGGPVCDFGPQMRCTFLQASGLNCSNVGLMLNPTQMACRSLSKQALATYDPTGYCLDNTPSGSQLRSPMPTP